MRTSLCRSVPAGDLLLLSSHPWISLIRTKISTLIVLPVSAQTGTYIGNRSSVSYASLPPGTHYFEVKATNSAGVWSPSQASITLVMEPFFYQTNWFWILTAILGLSTVALLFCLTGAGYHVSDRQSWKGL